MIILLLNTTAESLIRLLQEKRLSEERAWYSYSGKVHMRNGRPQFAILGKLDTIWYTNHELEIKALGIKQ